MPINEPRVFDDGLKQIDDSLFQGGMFDVLRHWETIKPHIDTVIVLTGELGRCLPDNGPRVIWFPIDDNALGLEADTFTALKQLCAEHASERVLTICYMGENRSGLASVLTLIARGKTPTEAAAIVRANGPSRSTGASFWNSGFNRQVAELTSADR